MVLKLYLDLISQPSRALNIFFRAAKIPFEPCLVPLRKGAHRQADFLQINRFGRLPAIDDDGFTLSESVAILRYVTRKYPVDDHWYPKDGEQRARVDEFLEWQHIDLRAPCASFVRMKIITPKATGREATQATVDKLKAAVNIALDNFEKHWLGNGTPYVVGSQISIADILAACEIEQTRMAGYDPTEGRATLCSWLQRIRSQLEPYYGDAHVHLNRVAEKNAACSKL